MFGNVDIVIIKNKMDFLCKNSLKQSLHYNPFAYIKLEKDILKLVTAIMANTKGEGKKEQQDFWYKLRIGLDSI